MEHRILIGVTGASGAVYAERLVDVLVGRVARICGETFPAKRFTFAGECRDERASGFDATPEDDAPLQNDEHSIGGRPALTQLAR